MQLVGHMYHGLCLLSSPAVGSI